MKSIITQTHKTVPILFRFSHQEKKKKFFKIVDGQQQKQPIVYPNQYPNYPLTDAQPIISRERPPRRITPKYEVPNEMMMDQDQLIKINKYEGKWKSPQNAYTLNVGLIGPVNAGKSELFGALAHRISAVSAKASTTTQIIAGLKSFQRQTQEGVRNVQIKYLDTPGLMYKKQGFLSKGWKVLSQIDFSLLVVDSAKRFDDMVKQSIKRLQKHREYPNFMKSLVLNKIDLVDNRRKFDSLIREIEKYGKFDKIFYVSAKTGYGIKQLQDYLIKMAKPGEWEYPAQAKTTLTSVQIYEQMMREAIYNRSYKQVPHNVLLTCISHCHLTNGKDQIIFDLFVESENQQRMLIGTQGKNIRQMMDRFKVSYAKMYQKEANVIVSVKIKNAWKKRHPGWEEFITDDEKQQDEQRLKILNQTLDHKRLKGVIRNIDIGDSEKN